MWTQPFFKYPLPHLGRGAIPKYKVETLFAQLYWLQVHLRTPLYGQEACMTPVRAAAKETTFKLAKL